MYDIAYIVMDLSIKGRTDLSSLFVNTYIELREPEETFLQATRRLGVEPFKERLYGDS